MRARPSGSRCVNSGAMARQCTCASSEDTTGRFGRTARNVSAADLAHRARRGGRSRPARCGDRPTSSRPRASIAAARRSSRSGASRPDAAAQLGAEIGFVERKETRAELAFRGEPHAIAVVAERLGDARDHADVADAVAIDETFRRLDVLAVIRALRRRVRAGTPRRCARGSRRRARPCRSLHSPCASSGMNSMNRTADTVVAAEAREVDDLVVVDAAHHDRVDLDRREAGVARRVDPGKHAVELVALRQREEAVATQRVERHVDALQTRRPRDRARARAGARRSSSSRDRRRAARASGPDESRARARAARRPVSRIASNPKRSTHTAGDACDLLVGEELFAGQPLHALGRHAVGAPEVAAIGDRDPQVLDAAIERVDQRRRRRRSSHRGQDMRVPERPAWPPRVGFALSSPPAQRPTPAVGSSLPWVCSVAPARRAVCTVPLGAASRLLFRPPWRPRSEIVVPRYVKSTQPSGAAVTYGTLECQPVATPTFRANTRTTGRSSSGTGIAQR